MKTDFYSEAKSILLNNDRGGYTVPTEGLYPFQWNWDSAFVALGFAQFDRPRAWQELHSLFSAQWENRMQPHIVFHQEDDDYFPGPSVWQTNQPGVATSGITQPPVAASIVRLLWEQDKASAMAHIERLYPKLMAWHTWFANYRDPLKNGLVLVTHPWETGRDNSPEWDSPMSAVDTSAVGEYARRDLNQVDQSMRPTTEQYDHYLAMVFYGREHNWDPEVTAKNGPFQMLDVGMSMILLRANRDLLVLAEALGKSDDVLLIKQRIELAENGLGYLWNDDVGAYCSYDLIQQQSSHCITNASFLAFYAGVGSPAQKQTLLNRLQEIRDQVAYLVPSITPEHPAYNPILYWRGPIWSVVNFMIGQGLMEQGYTELSDQVWLDTLAVSEAGNFYESFSPATGKGTGGKQFSWSAAIWLHLNAWNNTRDGQ